MGEPTPFLHPVYHSMVTLKVEGTLYQVHRARFESFSTSFKELFERADISRTIASLLDKLSLDTFEEVSAQLMEWVELTKDENTPWTLFQIAQTVYEKGIEEGGHPDLCACLCRTLVDLTSDATGIDGIREPSGVLFKRYILSRIKGDWERVLNLPSYTGDDALYPQVTFVNPRYHRPQLLTRFWGALMGYGVGEEAVYQCLGETLSTNWEMLSEEALSKLARLIGTLCPLVDPSGTHPQLNRHFAKIEELSRDEAIDPRVRSLLKDLVKLRSQDVAIGQQIPHHPTIPVDPTQAKPLVLSGCRTHDFERLLTLLYPRDGWLPGDVLPLRTREEWSSVLHLSALWKMEKIRQLAETQLSLEDVT